MEFINARTQGKGGDDGTTKTTPPPTQREIDTRVVCSQATDGRGFQGSLKEPRSRLIE